MKTKIIGLFFCMLLIAAMVPTVESFKNNAIKIIIPNVPQQAIVGNWTEIQKLIPASENKAFGSSISIDGDTAIIGAELGDGNVSYSGCAYVFIRTESTWTQQAKLYAADGATYDFFGCSVSLSGDTALVGAIFNDGNSDASGSAYVFIRSGTTWTQQQKLFALDGAYEDRFGISVSLDGDTAIIGAMSDDDNGNDSGSAYVFTRSGTTWVQYAKLVPSDGEIDDAFGHSVCLGDTYAFIGSINDDDMGYNHGSVYVFIRSGWTQVQKLFASDGSLLARFGWCISFDGSTALISAPQDDENGLDSGSAYIFTCMDSVWAQQAKLVPSDGKPYDYSGYSVSLNGDTALIGATGHDDNGESSGSVYVFVRKDTTWEEQQELLSSDGAENDRFGSSVSVFGDTAIIGAADEDGNGTDSGSAYVFTRSGADLTVSIIGGFGIYANIKNNGVTNVSGIPWQIHVEGGIFRMINTTVGGTIDIPMGETRTVSTGLFLGLGPFTVVVKVDDVEKTATGIILLFYVLEVT